MATKEQFRVTWHDAHMLPKQVPDLRYPEGVDLDVSGGAKPTCVCELPYPALRIGAYNIECHKCKMTALVSTAGRFDDPRSIKFACGVRPLKTQLMIAPHARKD